MQLLALPPDSRGRSALFILTSAWTTRCSGYSRSRSSGAWWFFARMLKERVATPLRTLASLLEAMRKGDYSIRAAHEDGDALGEVMSQVNAMGATLREQRLGAMEATTLLRKVMEEIDVAVFAFDGSHQLRLVNRAGERLLGRHAEQMVGADARPLG